MEDAFMNFTSTPEAWDEAFTELTTTNGNISTKLGNQEDQIWAMQAEIHNLKVVAETFTAEEKVKNKGGHPYTHEEKQKLQ